MSRFVLLVMTLLIAAWAAPVAAAPADDEALCANRGAPADAAIAACSRAISSGRYKGPPLAKAHNLRGLAHEKKGDLDRAFADYSAAIRLDPTDSVYYANRAFIHSSKHDYDKAIADTNEAIRVNPNAARAYGIRGYTYAQKGDDDRALSDYNRAVQIDPTYASGYHNRGLVYSKRGDYQRAIADLNEAARYAPNQPQVFAIRAGIFEKTGDLNRALADYREVARLAPARQEIQDTVRRLEQRIAAATPQVTPQATPQVTPQVTPQATAVPPPVVGTVAQDGKRVALVIGNGGYAHATRLPNPANDAADIAQMLRKLGFQVIEGRDLDKRGMEDKVREFNRALDSAALALFFYAGHGMQVGGRNFLLPTDSKLERPGDLNFETIDVSFILAQMEADKRVNLIFLDACRDNPLSRSFARSMGTRSASVGQGLATIQSAIGTMIAYATQPDAVALDGEGRNSPFTTALLKHLTTPGLEIGALMRRVRSDVITATREKQVPWDHSSLIGEVVLAR